MQVKHPGRMLVATLFLTVAAALSACGGGADLPAHPTPVPATAAAQSAPATTASTETEQRTRKALDYLRSPARASRFDSLAPKAGIIIAKALEAGRFGETRRYNADKIPLQPGQATWGGISSQDNEQFAWVYWNGDGTIDYGKPITQIAINNANSDQAGRVSMFGPSDTDPANKFSSYWTAYVAMGGYVGITDVRNIIIPRDLGAALAPGDFYGPESLSGLMALDELAFSDLQVNMASWFGRNWAA